MSPVPTPNTIRGFVFYSVLLSWYGSCAPVCVFIRLKRIYFIITALYPMAQANTNRVLQVKELYLRHRFIRTSVPIKQHIRRTLY